MKTVDQILNRMISHHTLVCCGLDPDLTKLPFEIHNKIVSDEDKVYEFLCNVVDITFQYVCVYKAQKAFFDILPGGHNVLKEIISYIHKMYSVPVILDCKIGDIDNTMSVYIKNIFGNLQADGLVANPYMGDDTIMPLAEFSEKAIVVLVNTSNPNGSVIQNISLPDGFPFWRHILNLVVNRWNYNGNMIPVLSSSNQEELSEVRLLIPDRMPILLAGIGVQGGSYINLRNLLNTEKNGVFVNSSRGILYSSRNQKSWKSSIKKSIVLLKNELNKEGGR